MSKKITPWVIALLCAILLHLLILKLSAEQKWLDTEAIHSNFELVLLPDGEGKTITTEDSSPTPQNNLSEESISPLEFPGEEESTENELNSSLTSYSDDSQELGNQYFNSSTDNTLFTDETNYEKIQNTKPDLLDISTVNLDTDEKNRALDDVFSEDLRNKITESSTAQQEYLKGQIKEIDYPVIIGADGARYANIKGVCWRIPEVGSDEAWAIVFSGCTGKSKTFHFEFNIAPNLFLGTESPLFIGQ